MIEKDLASQIRRRLVDVVGATGLVVVVDERLGSPMAADTDDSRLRGADIVLTVENRRGQRTELVVEVKGHGSPSAARLAASQLWALIRRRPGVYGVVGIAYASEETRRVCEEMEVGLIDLAGNCLLKFDDVYISIEGRPNPFKESRTLRSPFSKKSSRCARVLLQNPRGSWNPQTLAAEASVSIGLSYKFVKELVDRELLSYENDGPQLVVPDPEKLLKAWADGYSYRKSDIEDYYSPAGVETNEARLATYCAESRIRCAFTLTSGAARVAPALRYGRSFAYVDADPDDVARALGWKPASTGANVTLLRPYDKGVFYAAQLLDGANVVCGTQLYVDLASYKGRGEEAAEAVLKQVLYKLWNQPR